MDLPAAVSIDDSPSPAPDEAGFGILRERLLDALLFMLPCTLPASSVTGLLDWARTELAHMQGETRGIGVQDVPPDMLPVLRWAGAPLARWGELHWGRDIAVDDSLRKPEREGDRLLVPTAERLALMTSLTIKPMRGFIADRCGVRMQVATGVALYLWDNGAILISRGVVPLAGFLHGPGPSRRSNLALGPGDAQTILFDG